MKIALVSAYFYPYSQGGTEKYLLNLAKKLLLDGHNVHIITVDKNNLDTYKYQNIKVFTIKDELHSDDQFQKDSTPKNIKDFAEILINQRYDTIHFHTLTPAINICHIELAKKTGALVHFTAHIPAITCIHGDLMEFGRNPCDGYVSKTRCTSCYLSKKGLSIFSSTLLTEFIFLLHYPINIYKAVERKKYELKRLNQLCNEIFLFTQWQKKVFIENGFDALKITITSQLINRKLIPGKAKNKKISNVGFVGRISTEKGLHILLKAFNQIKRPDLKLHIAGISNDQNYELFLKRISSSNANVTWHFNLDSGQISEFYKKIDLLVIPSISYETGPFVLFEAIENNIPIIANNLGDMNIWKERGFDLHLYNKESELILLLSSL